MAARKSSKRSGETEPQRLDVRVHMDRQPTPVVESVTARPSNVIWATTETRIFARANAGLLGPRAGAQFPLSRWLVLDTDVGALWGSAHDPLGEVNETVVTAGIALRGTYVSNGLSLGVGPRLEAGAAWFRGEASAPTSIASDAQSATLFFACSGVASFQVEGPISGLIGIDAGTTFYGFGARADSGGEQRHVSDLLGPFLGARLGLGWAP
jgi:hypothetical protein